MSDYTDKIDELAGFVEVSELKPIGPATRRWLAHLAAKAARPQHDKCCVCNEYPWPHGIGVGRCNGVYPVRAVVGP